MESIWDASSRLTRILFSGGTETRCWGFLAIRLEPCIFPLCRLQRVSVEFDEIMCRHIHPLVADSLASVLKLCCTQQSFLVAAILFSCSCGIPPLLRDSNRTPYSNPCHALATARLSAGPCRSLAAAYRRSGAKHHDPTPVAASPNCL